MSWFSVWGSDEYLPVQSEIDGFRDHSYVTPWSRTVTIQPNYSGLGTRPLELSWTSEGSGAVIRVKMAQISGCAVFPRFTIWIWANTADPLVF